MVSNRKNQLAHDEKPRSLHCRKSIPKNAETQEPREALPQADEAEDKYFEEGESVKSVNNVHPVHGAAVTPVLTYPTLFFLIIFRVDVYKKSFNIFTK